MKAKSDGELSIVEEGSKAVFLGQGLGKPGVFPLGSKQHVWETQPSSGGVDVTVKMASCLSSPER